MNLKKLAHGVFFIAFAVVLWLGIQLVLDVFGWRMN